jgi:two-component system, OmpR family, phosphate regulon response regulator PhoB
MKKSKIYVVEDEESLALLLKYNLTQAGFEVETIARGDLAEIRLLEEKPDLLLLDWMLPGISGVELCRRIKARAELKDLPVIMLTARSEESDKVQGLQTGADDYVVKPFSVVELIARINALLRRVSPERLAQTLTYDTLTLDKVSKTVTREGKNIHLGPTEFKLLEFFLEKPHRVYNREQILDNVWGRENYIDERTVDVHIGRLRSAINSGFKIKLVRTVRSAGYSLEQEK